MDEENQIDPYSRSEPDYGIGPATYNVVPVGRGEALEMPWKQIGSINWEAGFPTEHALSNSMFNQEFNGIPVLGLSNELSRGMNYIQREETWDPSSMLQFASRVGKHLPQSNLKQVTPMRLWVDPLHQKRESIMFETSQPKFSTPMDPRVHILDKLRYNVQLRAADSDYVVALTERLSDPSQQVQLAATKMYRYESSITSPPVHVGTFIMSSFHTFFVTFMRGMEHFEPLSTPSLYEQVYAPFMNTFLADSWSDQDTKQFIDRLTPYVRRGNLSRSNYYLALQLLPNISESTAYYDDILTLAGMLYSLCTRTNLKSSGPIIQGNSWMGSGQVVNKGKKEVQQNLGKRRRNSVAGSVASNDFVSIYSDSSLPTGPLGPPRKQSVSSYSSSRFEQRLNKLKGIDNDGQPVHPAKEEVKDDDEEYDIDSKFYEVIQDEPQTPKSSPKKAKTEENIPVKVYTEAERKKIEEERMLQLEAYKQKFNSGVDDDVDVSMELSEATKNAIEEGKRVRKREMNKKREARLAKNKEARKTIISKEELEGVQLKKVQQNKFDKALFLEKDNQRIPVFEELAKTTKDREDFKEKLEKAKDWWVLYVKNSNSISQSDAEKLVDAQLQIFSKEFKRDELIEAMNVWVKKHQKSQDEEEDKEEEDEEDELLNLQLPDGFDNADTRLRKVVKTAITPIEGITYTDEEIAAYMKTLGKFSDYQWYLKDKDAGYNWLLTKMERYPNYALSILLGSLEYYNYTAYQKLSIRNDIEEFIAELDYKFEYMSRFFIKNSKYLVNLHTIGRYV